jgi:hypothetical protein
MCASKILFCCKRRHQRLERCRHVWILDAVAPRRRPRRPQFRLSKKAEAAMLNIISCRLASRTSGRADSHAWHTIGAGEAVVW